MEIGPYIENIKGITNLIRDRIQRVSSSRRDKRAVVISAFALSILLLFLIFQFFSSGTEKLAKKANVLESDLNRIGTLRNELVDANKTISKITSSIKSGDEALISVVEDILVRESISRGNFSIKDSNPRAPAVDDLYNEKSVDVEIKKIPLNKMVDLLYKIQIRPSFLKVSKLRIRTRFDEPDLMDVNFRISNFKFEKVI
ncbi:hypothetical protein MYX76_11195 [Desulfobacterota bacterium AH_259_B03_O07]|nr:hypothetical protein [Desulfobacterota bacterium AH_259_B03_O07]